MPIYEYKCKACDREFEYQQRMSDPDKTECEACGASALERLISRTAFQLKGSGWYKDLYSSSKPESKPSPDSSSASTASASSDSASSSAAGSSSSSESSSSSSSGGTSSSNGTSGGGSGSKAAASAS